MAETKTEDLELIWGARDIAKAIRRTPRVTWGLLEAGEIAGAKKVGKRWCVSLHKLRETFGLSEAA
ncbi:hypothetical protein A9174_25620 [Mesorhizobium loti NZP2037]|nr:hypothetical protein [Mesorhizobium loti]ANN59761.1 hypothetical protein A9174_25620 [Mesorhizobium loti NZP2037]